VPLQILDTVVLIAALNRNDPLCKRATEHVVNIGLRRDIFVPSATLLELDLELKAHGRDIQGGLDDHSRLQRLIPGSRVLPIAPGVLARATELSMTAATWRASYFDTLIAATGLEFDADSAITTDRKFAKLGIKPVF
jgi:predicted nucleic-acid-binding protein